MYELFTAEQSDSLLVEKVVLLAGAERLEIGRNLHVAGHDGIIEHLTLPASIGASTGPFTLLWVVDGHEYHAGVWASEPGDPE
jgi:hypothetical protein